MKFWLPLTILLTAVSPKLNAGTIDPTTFPWEFDATFQNAPVLEALNIDDSILTFKSSKNLGGGNQQLAGEIDIFDGSKFWGTAQVGGWKFSNDLVILGMRWGALDFELIGVEVDPGRWVGGLRGLGSSDIAGSWTATQLDIPAALWLLGAAIGTVVLFPKRLAK